MRKLTLIFPCLFILLIFYHSLNAQSVEWTRVQSENGEFSIEVPTKYNFFYDEEGFWDAKDRNNYHLKKMNLLTAYANKTLLSVEVYQAKKSALEALYTDFEDKAEFSKITVGGVTGRQYLKTDADYRFVIRYFNTKNNVCVITAASRNGETAEMKRFLDSMTFNVDPKNVKNLPAVSFSSLPVSKINFSVNEKDFKKTSGSKDNPPPDEKVPGKLIVLAKPRPAYTDSARMKNITGLIQIKLDFSENGFISNITATKVLPEGLLRHAVFALLRVKYLPEEKDGAAQTVTKRMEYNFSIY